MIFSSYDVIQTTIDKSKPYIDVAHKQIICRLPIHRNFVIAKRFNTLESNIIYDFLLIPRCIPILPELAYIIFGLCTKI